MSYSKQITIWCDKCMAHIQISTTKISTARKSAKLLGWTYKKDKSVSEEWSTLVMKDLCPECEGKL